MQASDTEIVVITDTNILINFIHIDQLGLLGELPNYRVGLPPEVLTELTDARQRSVVDAAIAGEKLDLFVIDNIDALGLYGELIDLMGRGEAACLAFAATSGCNLASDEKKRFRSKAIELIGEDRILRTEDLLLAAIRCKAISVAQADEYKEILESNQYKMSFTSFSDFV